MIDRVREKLKDYYRATKATNYRLHSEEMNDQFYATQNKIWMEMSAYYAQEPDAPTCTLKSKVHQLIAENCSPVLFPENPFYYEIGMREGNSWGLSDMAPSSWVRKVRRAEILEKYPIVPQLESLTWQLFDDKQVFSCNINSTFDVDHNTLGYRTLFKEGLGGIVEKISSSMLRFDKSDSRWVYCKSMLDSCNAVLHIAEKFSLSAQNLLATAETEEEKEALKMAMETAKRIPYYPPQTFYEGLEMLIFMREITASLENIGVSSFGQMDLLLGELYEADLKAGRITEKRARQLIDVWLLYTDLKFDTEGTEWPETSTCIQLGGCDEEGRPVYSDVTRMIIEEHHRLALINPKLNCRYSQNSPSEYLEIIGNAVLAGHNNFVLINDDIIIDGLVENGVELADARAFVSGGCQETMIEGCGHTEGAAVYVSMAHVLEAFLYGKEGMECVRTVKDAHSFDEFYSQFVRELERFLAMIFEQRNIRQYYEKDALDCPLFSSMQNGCVESGTDYVRGGAKYNFSTVALLGFATVVDSLYAVKTLVYERKTLSLSDFMEILKNDWQGNEELRDIALSLPKFGKTDGSVGEFANDFLERVAVFVRNQRNERGGSYIPSLFVYYNYKWMSGNLGATPDGRRKSDLMSPGCSPSQLAPLSDAISTVQAVSEVDFSRCGGGTAVFDVMFPASKRLNGQIFASFIRACGASGCPTIQPNFLSVKDLMDAKVNPDKHRNIIVRVSGLSAYFVTLAPDKQDEIIARHVFEM